MSNATTESESVRLDGSTQIMNVAPHVRSIFYTGFWSGLAWGICTGWVIAFIAWRVTRG